jgi:hypothetical protein
MSSIETSVTAADLFAMADDGNRHELANGDHKPSGATPTSVKFDQTLANVRRRR